MLAALTHVAQGGLPGLGQEGPDDLQRLLKMFYVMFVGGVVIAVLGHAIPSKMLLIAGIALVFLSTGVFMVAVGSYG